MFLDATPYLAKKKHVKEKNLKKIETYKS